MTSESLEKALRKPSKEPSILFRKHFEIFWNNLQSLDYKNYGREQQEIKS